MGDIADMMIDGTLDMETGEYIGPGPGYPRRVGDTGMKYNKRYPKVGITMYLSRNFPELAKKDYNEFCFIFVQEHLEVDALNKGNRSWIFIAHKIQENWQLFVAYCNRLYPKENQ